MPLTFQGAIFMANMLSRLSSYSGLRAPPTPQSAPPGMCRRARAAMLGGPRRFDMRREDFMTESMLFAKPHAAAQSSTRTLVMLNSRSASVPMGHDRESRVNVARRLAGVMGIG